MIKCFGKDRNGDECRNNQLVDSKFCKFHQYMSAYNEDMLSKIELCGGCKKMYYFENGIKTCEKCRDRGKKNRKENREEIVLCSKKGCKFKKSDENKYCGKHQLCLFEDETILMNKKVCFNFIRGCRAQLENSYQYLKCAECLEIDREKDKKRRSVVVEKNNSSCGNIQELKNEFVPTPTTTTITTETKTCTNCCKIYPIDHFKGQRQTITKCCINCREGFKKNDKNRDKEHRNEIARKNEAKPERKAVKAKWTEDNYDKAAKRWMDYKQRQIEKLGPDEYLKKQAEQAKNWRENNPEKMIVANENKKNSKEITYSNYKRCADYKNLKFEIDFEEYVKIVENNCYYCGALQEKGFNGIDRKNQAFGYELDNYVSCCKMCNYMKGSTHENIFIKRVEHILTYQNLIDGYLFPDSFASHMGSCFSQYKNRANKKQLDFELTQEEYNDIIIKECFMCGKRNDTAHKNGIDRFDNNKGYILDNLNSCCGECNYMKKNYNFEDVINKFMLIYKNRNQCIEYNSSQCKDSIDSSNQLINSILHNDNFIETNESIENEKKNKNRVKQKNHRERMIAEHGIEYVRKQQNEKMGKLRNNNNIVKNDYKKTDEEKKEAARLRKQKQRENLREKYGNEEYKKMRANEIAANRKKKGSEDN